MDETPRLTTEQRVQAFKDIEKENISEIADQSKERIINVGSELEGEFEEESPETDETFEMCLHVVSQELDLDLDLDTVGEKAEEQSMIGMVERKFGGDSKDRWHLKMNWNQHGWAGKIPPGYCSISYADTEIAILGPWLTIRTCWNCQLKGWREDMFPAKIGKCLPGVECPSCGELDWWGRFVGIGDFIRDAAEYIADCGGGDKVYKMMAGRHG